MNLPPKPHSLREPGLRILTALLLAALPLLLVDFGMEIEFRRETGRLRELMVRDLERAAAPLLDPWALPFACLSRLEWIASQTRGTSHPEEILNRYLPKLKKAYPGVFEFAVFDRDSRFIATMSDLPDCHESLAVFGPLFGEFVRTGSPRLNESIAQFRRFLGGFFTAFPFAVRENGWYGLSALTRTRALNVFPKQDYLRTWFMAVITLPQNPKDLLVRMALEDGNRLFGWHQVIDLDDPIESWGNGFGEASGLVPKALGLLGEKDGKALLVEGFFWLQIRVGSRKRLLEAVPDGAEVVYRESVDRFRSACGLVLLLLVVGSLAPWWDRVTLSLRAKILLLFGYTTAIPVILLLLAGEGLFLERRQVMEKKLFADQEEAIREFSRQFSDYLGWVEEAVKAGPGGVLTASENPLDQTCRAFEKFADSFQPDIADLYDDSGGARFHRVIAGKPLYQYLTTLMGIQAARTISLVNGNPVNPRYEAKDQAMRASLESFGIDIDEVFAGLAATKDSLTDVNFWGEEVCALTLSLFDLSGKLRGLGFVGWSRRSLYERYIFHRLAGFSRMREGMLFGTFDRLGQIVPGDFPNAREAAQLFSQTRGHTTSARMKFTRDGRGFLLSGIQLENWGPFFAVTADDRIRQELRATAVRLGAIGIFLMVVGVGIGMMITRTFLRPVGYLAQGIEAMKNREFSSRIPVLAQDEFGQLSSSFNKMMESMADLELARIVQDTIFPAEPMRAEGWEVFGSSISASRVGGDYFDYLPLPDGRWLVLIGDVSGHGVPAALVVAMAKALVCHPDNPGRPGPLLEVMGRYLWRTMQRKRLMSCFLGFFEPRTRLLVFSNAGHNYPYLLRGDRAEEIRNINPLLGTQVRKPYQEGSLILGENEGICFYTDGLIETLDHEGLQIGYDRFSAALPGLRGTRAIATHQAVLGWREALAAPGPLADDITLMILQRC